MSKKSPLLERTARNLGSLFIVFAIFVGLATVVFADWPSGRAPEAAPGAGNVELTSTQIWSESGSNIYYNGGNVGIGKSDPSVKLEVVGDIKSTRFFYNSSDERLKKEIKIIPDALAKINQLSGVSFEWKNENAGSNLGVIAQNVEAVFPELVATDEISGMKSVQYSNLVAPLIEAVKELTARVEDLESQIAESK